MASLDYLMSVSLGIFCIFVSGVSGAEESSGPEGGWLIISSVGAVVVLVVAIAMCIDKRVHTELLDRGPPFWTRSLVFKPEYSGGFTATSDGLDNLSQFHVTRRRLGHAVTDGARWDVGFTEGKHVFEVQWPIRKNRGTFSSIGVGTMDVPLKKQGRLSLVGHHSQSWGLDLSSRKMVHANKPVGSFPRQIPDRFYIYLDLDGGKIGFGEDIKLLGRQALFYGNLVNNIRLDRSKPLYMMVGMCSPKEAVQVFYVGTAVPAGGFDLCPEQVTTVVFQQQQQGEVTGVNGEQAPPPPAVYQPTETNYQADQTAQTGYQPAPVANDQPTQ